MLKFTVVIPVATLSEVLFNALNTDPYISRLRSSISLCEENYGIKRYFEYSIEEAIKYGEVLTTEEKSSGVAVWCKPLAPNQKDEKKAKKHHFIATLLGDKALSFYRGVISNLASNSRKAIAHESWELSLLGVSPDRQGKGVGSRLLKPFLKRMDERNIPTYLESFIPENIPFYERLGFTVDAKIFEPTVGSYYYLMKRDPTKSASL